jgi:hypothetical protein
MDGGRRARRGVEVGVAFAVKVEVGVETEIEIEKLVAWAEPNRVGE